MQLYIFLAKSIVSQIISTPLPLLHSLKDEKQMLYIQDS